VGVEGASAERARTAVEELLASETLARSEQLRSFLRYVCDRTLAGQGKEINEYSVAVEALGKPPEFSPGEDSSVRRSAYELRQKLQKYYETERPGAAVRIELPKGSYTPRFIEAPAASPPPPPRRDRLVPLLAAGLAASVLISIGLAAYALSTPRATRVDPVVREAWQPLTSGGRQVLISLGTNFHLIVRPYMTVVAEGLPKYPAPPELYPLFRQHRPLDPNVQLSMHPVDNSVQLGHAQALAIASTTLSLLGVPYQSLPERSASPPALRGRSVVLIGDPQNSNTVAQMLRNTPLTLEFDPAVQDVVVRERSGSHTVWAGKRGPDKRYTEVYGLISMLNAEGEGPDSGHTLIFSGITSVGTSGAAEFFSRPEGLNVLRRHLAAEGVTKFPPEYQIVVRCASNDTLLLSTEYLTHRILAPPAGDVH
jgi:hypothetical protein